MKLAAWIIASLAGTVFAAPARGANTWDALYDAGIKAVQLPHHVSTTKTDGRTGKVVQSTEGVFTGGLEYMRVGGRWRRSPLPQQPMLGAAQEKLKTHPDTCTDARDETVEGHAVTTHKVHDKEGGTDSLAHIFKSTGLLLGQTLTLPDGSLVKTATNTPTCNHPPA